MRKYLGSSAAILTFILGVFLLSSCTKDGNGGESGMAHVKMYLTDAPADYDAVNINIQSVEIHTDENGWKTYNLINPGMYDLLQFNSGVDTIILDEDMEAATVSQIRLILGDGSNVVIDGVTYPLETPSAEQSGVKMNVHYTFEPGIAYELWLDFDANQSIVEQGNGDYSLKPVITVYTTAESGAISGAISPINGAFYVMAVEGEDTSGTTINDDGTFLIGGLSAGSYDVIFSPEPGFLEVTVDDVGVVNGEVTDIGTVVIPL